MTPHTTRRPLGSLFALALLVTPAVAGESPGEKLAAAYPDFVRGVEGGDLVMTFGHFECRPEMLR